ncbi:MAG: hypothetical protein ACFFCD_11780 [Promethearchaeota archaeon]
MPTIHCIKIGGSLSSYPDALRSLMKSLDILSKSYRILIVPGGGLFADTVREMYRQYNLSETVAHWMAILAIDQYGFFLSNLSENAATTPSIDEAKELAKKNKISILLPFRLLYEQDPLEHSWDVTSDSIAAYIATLIDTESLILLKDVDGIFECDPKKEASTLIQKLNRHDFTAFETQNCVDKYFPRILSQSSIPCWILNGRKPSRIFDLLKGRMPIGTEVI